MTAEISLLQTNGFRSSPVLCHEKPLLSNFWAFLVSKTHFFCVFDKIFASNSHFITLLPVFQAHIPTGKAFSRLFFILQESNAPIVWLTRLEADLILATERTHHILGAFNVGVVTLNGMAIAAEGEVLAAQLDIATNQR